MADLANTFISTNVISVYLLLYFGISKRYMNI